MSEQTGYSISVEYIAADGEEAAKIRFQILDAINDVEGLLYPGGLIDVSLPAPIMEPVQS